MTDEQLILAAGASVAEMQRLLKELWTTPKVPLDLLNRLEQSSRNANSAIIALRQRAAGVPAPKLGDR